MVFFIMRCLHNMERLNRREVNLFRVQSPPMKIPHQSYKSKLPFGHTAAIEQCGLVEKYSLCICNILITIKLRIRFDL